jgi:hypothetical protein
MTENLITFSMAITEAGTNGGGLDNPDEADGEYMEVIDLIVGLKGLHQEAICSDGENGSRTVTENRDNRSRC